MIKFSNELVSNNKAFDAYIKLTSDNDKLIISRVLLIIATSLFAMFYVVDFISASENLLTIVLLRSLAIIVIFFVYLLSRNDEFMLKHYTTLLLFTFLVGGTAIVAMIYFSSSSEIAHKTYFAGLMLMIVAIFPLTYVNTKLLIFISFIFIFEYVVVVFFLKGEGSFKNLPLVANNCFFMLGAISLGLVSDFLKKRHLYRVFKTVVRLKELLLATCENDITIEKYNSNDEARSFLNQMLKDGKLCQLNICIMYIPLADIKELDAICNIISLSIPYKHKLLITKSELIYSYYYDYVDYEVAKGVNNQIENLLYEHKIEKTSILTYIFEKEFTTMFSYKTVELNKEESSATNIIQMK